MFCADLTENHGEGFAGEADFFAGAFGVKLRQQVSDDGLYGRDRFGQAHARAFSSGDKKRELRRPTAGLLFPMLPTY